MVKADGGVLGHLLWGTLTSLASAIDARLVVPLEYLAAKWTRYGNSFVTSVRYICVTPVLRRPFCRVGPFLRPTAHMFIEIRKGNAAIFKHQPPLFDHLFGEPVRTNVTINPRWRYTRNVTVA